MSTNPSPNPMCNREHLKAIAYLQPMNGGGSNAQLVQADDGNSYVIKLINNPQCTRILANEFVVAKLAELIGAPCPPAEIIDVDQNMVQYINSTRNQKFVAGPAFGSLYLANSTRKVFPSNPELMQKAANLSEWSSVVVLDTLVQNEDRPATHVLISVTDIDKEHRFWIIDHGHCLSVARGWTTLNADNMNAKVPSLYREVVKGKNFFETTFNSLTRIDKKMVDNILSSFPSDLWGVSDQEKQHLVSYIIQAIEPKKDSKTVLNLMKSSFPDCFEGI